MEYFLGCAGHKEVLNILHVFGYVDVDSNNANAPVVVEFVKFAIPVVWRINRW